MIERQQGLTAQSLANRLSGLTEQQAAFVQWAASGLDTTAAAEKAGYKFPTTDSWRLMQSDQVLSALHREVQRRLQSEAAISLEVLRVLRNDERTPPRVRADIGIQFMKMAGHIAPATKSDKPDKQLSEMTRDEMLAYIERNEREIDRAEAELAARAKDVSAHVGAQIVTLEQPKPLDFLD